MKKMKSKIDWVLVGIIIAVSLPIIAGALNENL